MAGARWRRVASCLHSLAGDGDTRGKAAVGASARAEGDVDLAPDARGPIHGSGHDSVPLPPLAPAASDGDGDTRSMAAIGQKVGRPPGLDPVKGGKEVGCPVSIR
jgi:hypothetical protein